MKRKQVGEVPGNVLAEWQVFYKKLFGIDCDFSNLIIPEKPGSGRWRLLTIANIKLETLYAKCEEYFPCRRWTDDNLDKIVIKNERDARNGAYAIWVKDAPEADEDLGNFSARKIKDEGILTETLTERLIHELLFFNETGDHLDTRTITLCSGSRFFNGLVPIVHCRDGIYKMYIDCDYPDEAANSLRSRQVVSQTS